MASIPVLQHIGEDIDCQGKVKADYKGTPTPDTSRYIDNIEREYRKNNLDSQIPFDMPAQSQTDGKEPIQVSMYSRLKQVKKGSK